MYRLVSNCYHTTKNRRHLLGFLTKDRRRKKKKLKAQLGYGMTQNGYKFYAKAQVNYF